MRYPVASLMDGARADVAAGRLVNATASFERALRIEPRGDVEGARAALEAAERQR